MLKRTIAVIVAMLAVAITVALAQAAPTKHHLKLTIKDATINSQGDRPGDKQSTAGLVTGQPFGQAVESITDKVTSATSTTVSFDGTITIYTSQGNLTGSIHIKITPTSTGANGTGRGTITHGTGPYRNARGNFTFTGAESANSPLFVSHATGSVSY